MQQKDNFDYIGALGVLYFKEPENRFYQSLRKWHEQKRFFTLRQRDAIFNDYQEKMNEGGSAPTNEDEKTPQTEAAPAENQQSRACARCGTKDEKAKISEACDNHAGQWAGKMLCWKCYVDTHVGAYLKEYLCPDCRGKITEWAGTYDNWCNMKCKNGHVINVNFLVRADLQEKTAISAEVPCRKIRSIEELVREFGIISVDDAHGLYLNAKLGFIEYQEFSNWLSEQQEKQHASTECIKPEAKEAPCSDNYYFTDKFRLKRPTPPNGFVPFKWKHKKDDLGNSLNMCPQCGEFGYVSGKDGFVDPKAQAFADKLKNRDDLIDFDKWCQEFEGDMIKCHPSRYHTWICSHCGCVIWMDWIQGYKDNRYIPTMSYYKPKEQTTLAEKKQENGGQSTSVLTDTRCRNKEELETIFGSMSQTSAMQLWNESKISYLEYEQYVDKEKEKERNDEAERQRKLREEIERNVKSIESAPPLVEKEPSQRETNEQEEDDEDMTPIKTPAAHGQKEKIPEKEQKGWF